MGKNRIIKSLGRNIGNLLVHKILQKYTNNPEAIKHLNHEIIAYPENVMEIAEEFNWNDRDIEEIKIQALEWFEKEMERDYTDVKFPIFEAEKIIDEILKDIMQE